MKRTNTAVWYDKKSRWQIKVQKDGIRKTFYSSTPGRTGQRECNAKADAWLDDGIDNPNAKISKLADEYLENLKLTASTSHYTQYEKYIRLYIKPKIGNVRIADLNEQHLQNCIDYAFSKKLAKKTLTGLRAAILAFVRYARKARYTTLHPEELTIPKGAPVGEHTILQPDDLKTLFASNEGTYMGRPCEEPFINAFRFEVSTGLRPGEILGLKWGDILGSRVFLRRAINVHGEETTGKNENARRSFTLTPIAKAVIDAQRKRQKALGISSEWVFTDDNGEQPGEDRYYRHWVAYCKHNGIARTTAYEMRHTFVSVIKTIPEGYLKQLVGHSKSMDTYGVYAHELTDDSKQAAELVGEIFSNILTPKKKADKAG